MSGAGASTTPVQCPSYVLPPHKLKAFNVWFSDSNHHSSTSLSFLFSSLFNLNSMKVKNLIKLKSLIYIYIYIKKTQIELN